MPPRFDAVFFDLDETLIPDDSVRDAALLETAREAGTSASPEALAAKVLEEARRLWGAFHAERRYAERIGTSSWEGLWMRIHDDRGDADLRALKAFLPEYRAQAWGAALAALGVRDEPLARKLADRFMAVRRKPEFCMPFPESRAVLDALRGGFRLGLITNGVPDLQREKLALSGLGGYFDAVLVSGEVGVGKPEAAIFLDAARALGVASARAAMVGDKRERDVAGATGVGMVAVWVNRRYAVVRDPGDAPRLASPLPKPDLEIPDLRPLPAWVARAPLATT